MGGCLCEYGCSMNVSGYVGVRVCTGNMPQKDRKLTCVVVILVQIDSFRSTVVVTLSVNMMCTHLYYCSIRCLYYNMWYILY